LDYSPDVLHFTRPAHRAAQAEPLSGDVVAKVDVSIDLQNGECASSGERS
jgi:hypothetical protein